LKKFLVILLACAVLVGGVVLLKKDNNSIPASPTNHVYSTGITGVKLVEYGDFECPGCGGFFPIIKQLKEKYKDIITFQFVNFPLTQIHTNALAAHRSAQAASNQNKFWEMHDLLYGNQQVWKSSTNAPKIFEEYATQLSLDMTRYSKDFASAETNAIINADIKSGQDHKVTGTPTFFLNDKQLEDNNAIATVEKFSKVIDAEILAKTGKASSATTPTVEVQPTTQN
jgi:protein-disulfide isomerase